MSSAPLFLCKILSLREFHYLDMDHLSRSGLTGTCDRYKADPEKYEPSLYK